MKIKIEIECDNAAFEDGAGPGEVARILYDLVRGIEEDGELIPGVKHALLDVNGNKVGEFRVVK